jgi:hypothetical protein
MRRGLFLVTVAVGLLALGGCAAEPSAPPSTNASSSASPSSSPTPSTTAPLVDPDAPEGQCDTKNLSVQVEPGEAAAGSTYSNIVFSNTGTGECALRDYPGVSVVGHGNGGQLGAPADRAEASSGISTVTLAPGGTAVAQLQEVNIGDGGGPLAGNCESEPGDGYRIYPPHSFDAVFVKAAVPACANGTVWMYVGAVTAG